MARSVYYCNYTIGEDAYADVPAVCGLYGSRVLLIGGNKGMAAGLPRLTAALAGSKIEIADKVVYGHDCTYAQVDHWAEYAKSLGVDMIFGMGGGKALDTAKSVGSHLGLPVFTFPTIAATCAATTALSVVYKEDGSFDSFDFYDRPAYHCGRCRQRYGLQRPASRVRAADRWSVVRRMYRLPIAGPAHGIPCGEPPVHTGFSAVRGGSPATAKDGE